MSLWSLTLSSDIIETLKSCCVGNGEVVAFFSEGGYDFHHFIPSTIGGIQLGVFEYEIEFHDSATEYEYEINAQTGDIISKSSEPYDFH